MHARLSGAEFDKGPMTKSIQEQCGINMIFPGKTEYMDRYFRSYCYIEENNMCFCAEFIFICILK